MSAFTLPQQQGNGSDVAPLLTSFLPPVESTRTNYHLDQRDFFTTPAAKGILPSCHHQRESDGRRVTVGAFIAGNPWSSPPKITSFRILGIRTPLRKVLNDGLHRVASDAMESSAAWKRTSWYFSRVAWTRRNQPRRVYTNECEGRLVLA